MPGYMVREELKREKLSLKRARRAWRYEEGLREGKGSIWTRRYLVEIEGRGMRGEGEIEVGEDEGNFYGGKRSEAEGGERR